MTAGPPAEHLRARLVAIADGLIPGTQEMPAPGSLDIAGRQLDLVLASRPDLADDLRRALEAASDADDPIAWVEWLAASDPPAHEAIVTVVVAGYYLHPDGAAAPRLPGAGGRGRPRRRLPRLHPRGAARTRARARRDLPADAAGLNGDTHARSLSVEWWSTADDDGAHGFRPPSTQP